MLPHDAGLPDPASNSPGNKHNPRPVAGRIDPMNSPLVGALEPPPGLSGGPDFGSLLRSLKRRWLAAATLGVLLAAVAGATAWFLMSPKYTAVAQIRIRYQQPPVLGNDGALANTNFTAFLRSQAYFIHSRPVITAVLKRDDVKKLNLAARYPDPAAFIEDELKVDFQDNQEFLTLTLADSDPQVATTVLKAVSESYLDQTGYGEKNGQAQRIKQLEEAYSQMKVDVQKKRDSHKELGKALGTTDPLLAKLMQEEVQSNLRDLRSQRTRVENELFKINLDEANLGARMAGMEKETLPDDVVEDALEKDAIAKPLLVDRAQMRQLLKSYQGLENEPTAKVARGRVAGIEKQLEERRKKLRVELTKRYLAQAIDQINILKKQFDVTKNFYNAELAKVDKELKEASARATIISGAPNELDTLAREIERDSKLFDDLGSKLEHEKIESRAPERISLHQEAELQKKDNKKQLMASVGCPLGALVLVCMGVAWSDYRQRRGPLDEGSGQRFGHPRGRRGAGGGEPGTAGDRR